MPFLLVGDNRSNTNWGGRSASLALFSLVRTELGTGESVTGGELGRSSADYGFRTRLLPPSKLWLARALTTRPTRNPLVTAWKSVDRALGAGDFLTDDPERSVRNLLNWRARDPGLQSLLDRVERADVVVVNGEGDVVFGRPVRRQVRFFAMIIHLARKLGKRVVFANAMLSDCPRTGRHPGAFAAMTSALRLCDVVCVRDPHSRHLAREEMGIADCHLVPDALFHWYDVLHEARRQLPANGDFVIPHPENDRYLGRLDLSGDYICVGGNSIVTQPGQLAPVAAGYRRLCEGLAALGLPVIVVVSDGRDTFLEDTACDLGLGIVPLRTPIYLAAAIVSRARLFVSGRYHPTIMASLGGTPSIFLATGAHKMHSLATVLDYPDEEIFPADLSAADVSRVCSLARERLAAGDSLRTRVEASAARRAAETDVLGRLIAARGTRTRMTVEPRHV